MSQPDPPAEGSIDPTRVSFLSIPTVECPYTELTPHARGGLGEVFRATDPHLHRTVAVKQLHGRLADSESARRRFLVEAEVTARLEHPGVVPVYRVFADATGRPAYAMRFIQGQTFWEVIQDYHAGPPDAVAFRRLLQCLMQVCQTVAYAHSRGVIHRDLKPQNIMLGKFGETLVLDWGLAKVVGRPEEVKAAPHAELTLAPESGSGVETAMGSAVGTPAYMSPEQAAGRWDVINHATDVYGLGAVLYTLLTGKPPLDKGNWPEMQQKIQQGDFPRPRQVRPEVPEALEAVCLKAMARQPEARYPSALALAADVEDWLADEPVTAYREPRAARARRWMRRHRTLVTAAAVLLVCALVGAGVGLGLLGAKNRQIAAERNAAEQAADGARRAADEAEAINAFLTEDLLGQADPDLNSRDKQMTVEQLLAQAAAKIDGNRKFAGRPAVEATLRTTIGKTYYKLGKMREAEAHLRRAMELRQKHLPPGDLRTLAAQETFADFLNLGPAKFAEAGPLARRTWEARAQLLGAEHRDTLDSMDTYTSSLRGLGRRDEAISLARKCLEARRRILGPTHPDTLTSMNNLATFLHLDGGGDEALALYRETLSHRDRATFPMEHSIVAHNLLNMLYFKGDLDEAERLLGEHLGWCLKRFTASHHHTDRARGLLLRIWLDQGKVADALKLSEEVVAYRRKTYPPENAVIALALADRGRALVLSGRYVEAEEALREARKIYPTAPEYGEYHPAWAACWHGASLTGLKRYAEGEAALLAGERKLRESANAPSRHRRRAAELLAKLYDAWGKPAEAAKWRAKLGPANGK